MLALSAGRGALAWVGPTAWCSCQLRLPRPALRTRIDPDWAIPLIAMRVTPNGLAQIGGGNLLRRFDEAYCRIGGTTTVVSFISCR